jgi:hypothetical protein
VFQKLVSNSSYGNDLYWRLTNYWDGKKKLVKQLKQVYLKILNHKKIFIESHFYDNHQCQASQWLLLIWFSSLSSVQSTTYSRQRGHEEKFPRIYVKIVFTT